MRFASLAVGMAVTFSACGGDGGDGGPSGPTPNSIAVSAGDDQVAAAGTALPESLAVIVRDQGGAALGGITVTWTITAGGGSVSPTASTTSAAGIAKTRRTLGSNAGTQTARATVTGLTPVTFDAIAQIQGAVNIANATTGPLTDTVLTTRAESLTVLVTDQNAVPVEGVTVTWASAAGTVSPTSRATSATGHSRTQFTYGETAGNQVATATVTGLVDSPVSVTLNATAGAAVGIDKTGGDNGTAPPSSNVTYTVTARDSYDNPKSGVTIDWAIATGGGSIAPPQNTTAASGDASATRTLGSGTGTQTATATAADLPGSPSVTFTTTAQTAAAAATVEVSNNVFTPDEVTIATGGTVTWEWQGTTAAHNVTFATTTGAPTNIGDMTSGEGQRTFNTAGTFSYQCTNHPPGMTGTVTVNP